MGQVRAAVPESGRSGVIDTLDHDLWAAAQSIITSRQERITIYGALDKANMARAEMERNASNTQRVYEELKVDYHQLSNYCKTLHGQHGDLQGRYDSVCADLVKALEGQSQFQDVRNTLENETAHKEAIEFELRQANDELTALEDREFQKIRTRDIAIENLQREVQGKDAKLVRLTEQVERLKNADSETIGDYEAKNAEIARLKAANAAHELAFRKYQEVAATLTSEKESATLIIHQQLEFVKNALFARFPELDENLDNLQCVLAKNVVARKVKKRKCAK